jgi:hypothetical protein
MRDDSSLTKRERQTRAATMSRVEPADLSRFEGEGGPEAPEPARPRPEQQGLLAPFPLARALNTPD